MKKPIIGISGSIIFDNSGDFSSYHKAYVGHDYILAVIKNGGVPLILPFCENQEIAMLCMEQVDALILSGGYDISPLNYKEEPLEKLGDTFPERDIFEMWLLQAAILKRKPILGICRGLQLINTYFGGHLYQDISYAKVSKDIAMIKHDQQNATSRPTHSIKINIDTLLFDIMQENHILVNSFHHQAIKEVGSSLVVNAVAKDGIIEGIEKPDYPFLLGVQWHPEMMHNSTEKMNRIFYRFINAAKNQQ